MVILWIANFLPSLDFKLNFFVNYCIGGISLLLSWWIRFSFLVVSRAILIARAPSSADIARHPLMKVKSSFPCFWISGIWPEIYCFICCEFFWLSMLFPSLSLRLVVAFSGHFNLYCSQPCRSLIIFPKRLSGNVHFLWSFLKQSIKREKMQRYKVIVASVYYECWVKRVTLIKILAGSLDYMVHEVFPFSVGSCWSKENNWSPENYKGKSY